MNKINKAFTLIELLVVIAIIGILSGFVAISMNGAINVANDGKIKANLDTIKKATIVLGVTNGSYPVEAGCTIGSCAILDPLIQKYIPSVNSGTYTYQSNGTAFTLSSALSTGYSYQFNSSTNTYSTNAPVAGVCGSKNGKYAAATPTGTEACSSGTITGMTGSYSWTCVNGGTSSGTCATVAATYAAPVIFTTVGTTSWTVPANVTSVEYLVVGGGAGAGSSPPCYYAGGGGGQVKTGNLSVSPGASLSVAVGDGGGQTGYDGIAGGVSTFSTITSNGGNPGQSGGAYGGTNGDGVHVGYLGSCATGGGGGGATASAINGSGGAGVVSSISGASVIYGGGGSGWGTSAYCVTPGCGDTCNSTACPRKGFAGIVIVKYINNY